jgi:hypothetical protein
MKNIYFYFIIIIICFAGIDNIIKGQNYFSQIAFSICFGFSIYLLVFYGINIRMSDGVQFFKIINKFFWFFIALFIFLILFLFFIFVFVIYIKNKDKLFYDDNDIEHQDDICIDLEYVKSNKRFLNLYENNYKINFLGSIVYFGFFLSSIVSLLSVKLEYYFIFNKNRSNFLTYNFNSNEINNVSTLTTSITSINIVKDCKWNNTSNLTNFIRFLVILFLSILCFLPYFLIQWDKNFVYVFFVKIMFSSFMFSFGIFFWFKILLNKLNLINPIVYGMNFDELYND